MDEFPSRHRSETSETIVMTKRRAIVLLSGGLDSTTCLAAAQADGFEAHAISFRYGQRHEEELRRAAKIASSRDAASHRTVTIDLAAFGGSALVDESMDVPKHARVEELGDDIPLTYVPARNTVFLSLALALAETIHSTDIFIGVNALDYSGYPDCRPEYIAAFEKMANLATRAGIEGPQPLRIHAPLLHMTKADIIRFGTGLGVDYSDTISCYDPVGGQTPCGRCDACLLRARGFDEAGIADPTIA